MLIGGMNGVLNDAIYFLAILNPISKVFLLSFISQEHDAKDIKSMILRSSILAFLVLVTFATVGSIILSKIFHIEFYALKITGGIIFFVFGYKAISKGKFFEAQQASNLDDISIVPLVYPMMAGPATITAVMSFSAQSGVLNTTLIAFSALLVNMIIMFLYDPIFKILSKYRMTGSLIRMTGLIVSTIAVQMVLDGLGEWASLL